MDEYIFASTIFKVLSEPIRLQVVDILSCGEMCACDILKNLSISQPTLSHHMKALIGSELVTAHKRATWMYYSINYANVEKLHRCISTLTNPKDDCPCKATQNICSCCDGSPPSDVEK